MADVKGILDALMTTWPVKTGEGILSALMAPGNAYRSTPDNPVTTAQMVEPASGLAGLMMLGATGAPAMSNAAGMGIRAYHGSPHDFNKFDATKIGTGEGAQVFGHGLYFAENPKVAQQYRDKLTVGNNSTPVALARSLVNDYGGDRAAALTELRKRAATADPSVLPRSNIPEAIDLLESAAPLGRMYEVNINARPEQFLDWDKGGQNIYETLARQYQRGPSYAPVSNYGAHAASNNLLEQGVQGIRYLDQFSRPVYGSVSGARLNPNNNTNNYVVFNPSIVDILRKYGLAGTLGGTAAIGAGSEDR